MTPVQKLLGMLVLAGLLIAAGAGLGAWLAAGHYRPQLDAAQDDLATAKAGRANLEALAGEQGRKLGELVLAGREREQRAAQAQADARELAQGEYAAANRLLQERTGGDQCAAATVVIDQELGL
ncbi:hypothetical protein [Pseudomonas chlororaphis]|uniref:hypothetical protein n=1 Tax=Pseudomonas chlororaphis TaxID=587753 RepID=UPI0006A5D460|nr:hypothetical protein [Pseudomonas chlororaphis]AZD01407.1 hypothetical protein C4K27_2213 [Pseudomonas chlororaphis subsp. chlororaphis]MBM0285091.1 hypothetical protein [Pseudomonas chlororaphis]MDO1505763.1 hypothetical protein [Pseudomonas chlororaphis]ORM49773.1 hypothetical protein B6D51_01130 [Pseudomonas chlororaphis subsp. chlororaphis]TWR99050.1 hypothetical protein FJD36_03540 [Pseudomonas chlororaphis subsp. chlororaphis]